MRRFPLHPAPIALSALAATALLAFGPATPHASAAPPEALTGGGARIEGYRNLWSLHGEAREQPESFQIDAIVHYYDPVWRQLWAQDGDATFFLTPPPEVLPIKAGQLVRLRGTTVPARLNAVLELSASVLDPQPVVVPLPADGRLTEHQHLNERLVEFDATVASQQLNDPNHLRLVLHADSLRIDGVLWLEAASTIPQVTGQRVRVRGVYHTETDTAGASPRIEVSIPGPGGLVLARHPSAETGVGGPAETDRISTPTTTPVAGFRNFLNAEGATRDRPRPFQIDATILAYDPAWHLLWAQEGDTPFFIAPPPGGLPIRAGQLVRLSGVSTAAAFSKVSHLEATVLDPQPRFAPLATAGRLHEHERFNERFVEIEGHVDYQSPLDARHLRCQLVAEGWRIEATVQLGDAEPPPDLVGALVRIRGLYTSHRTPDGQLQSIGLAVPDPSHVAITGHLRDDPRFTLPLTPVDRLPTLAPDTLIHVAGAVTTATADRSVTIRDDTGQLELLTPQRHGLRTGDRLEAIGRVANTGHKWQLRQALVRGDNSGGAARPAIKQLIRLADQVLALPLAQAAAFQPVQLDGVVTWSHPTARYFYLQDPSGGVRIELDDPSIAVPERGAGLLVQGNSTMGAFAPSVIASRLINRYQMSPPVPPRLVLEAALTGAHEAQWVELGGLLRATRPEGIFSLLQITTPTGDFEALAPTHERFATLLGSFVAIRGVCVAQANDQRQLTGLRLWVPTVEDVVVEEAPPTDLFALPEYPISGLRQFGPLQSYTHWLRTGGTVTYQAPGHHLVVQDGAEALTVYTDEANPLEPGTRVEVVGSPGRDGSRLVLRNAQIRRLAGGVPVPPLALPVPFPVEDRFDSRLVRLAGLLDEASDLGGQHYLEVRHPQGFLIARLVSPTARPATWRRGAAVELTGIYRLLFDEHRRRTGFELLLRSPADLRVLQPPPWWTPARTLGAVAALAAAVALGVLWVAILRRRLAQQTRQIRAQLAKEAHLEAELERAQRLQSLGTLAGGIAHDFNNLLTVIMGNITLAMLDERVMALAGDSLREAEGGAARARDLTQQMLTFARGGDPIREHFALPPLVHETAALALSGAKVRAEIHVPPGLPAVHADRAQINRALHNILAHANSVMRAGGVVTLDLALVEVAAGHATTLAPGRYLRLAIADHGEPLPAADLPTLFDPYAASKFGGERFGLATAYSIARKHGGLLAVRAEAARGNTFDLWLPAAPDSAATDAGPVVSKASPQTPAAATGAGARVIFMDDEPGIRQLGELLLRHLQCEPIMVQDGAECLAAYRAAQAAGRPIDLVVMDLTIPGGMGGRETIAELLRIDPSVRAIVSSGYANDPILAHYREHGFAAVVTKPYEIGKLAEAVLRVLAEPRSG